MIRPQARFSVDKPLRHMPVFVLRRISTISPAEGASLDCTAFQMENDRVHSSGFSELWKSLPDWEKPVILAAFLTLAGFLLSKTPGLLRWVRDARRRRVEDDIIRLLTYQGRKKANQITSETGHSEKAVSSALWRLHHRDRLVYHNDYWALKEEARTSGKYKSKYDG